MSAGEIIEERLKERWRTATRFADVLEGEIKSRQAPVVGRVATWLNLCRVCQDVEDQLLLQTQMLPEDLQLHRALLSLAIGSGEMLLLERIDSRALESLQVTVEGLEAKIESLRITFEQWHTELKAEREQAVLAEVFGGEA